MKTKILILFVVFLASVVSCNKSMKWNNENDPNADIYGKCDEGSFKCYGSEGDYTSLVCKKGKWEKYEICDENCNMETGKCEAGNVGNDSDNNDPDPVQEDDPAVYTEQNRVAVRLAWKQGFASRFDSESKEGAVVDLDLHLIKMTSLEAKEYNFQRKAGLLGTNYRSESMDECLSTDPGCEQYWRHDDCSFSDRGLEGVAEGRTIQWNARFTFDNSWGGGGNYKNPETISMGPLEDKDGDGVPDTGIMDDQYLVVVGYSNCGSFYNDSNDRCDSAYIGEDSVYEVDARVSIFVDGEEVPRAAGADRPADHYFETTKDFKIKLNEWKVVALIKWDNTLQGPAAKPEYAGNAVVTDVSMPKIGIVTDPLSHPVCVFDSADALLIPIWDPATYKNYIEMPDMDGRVIGKCSELKEREPIEGDQRTIHCEGLPATGAAWNTVYQITQEYDGEKWVPPLEGTYNEEASTTECRFKCKEHYNWDESTSQCIAETRQAACEGLPENAEWNTVSEITQTWNGTGWEPSSQGSYGNSSTERCHFHCKENYNWELDDSSYACKPATRYADCPGKPQNSVWNDNGWQGTYIQTWSEEAGEWLPQYDESLYGADYGDCRFVCDTSWYGWNGSECVLDPCLYPSNPCTNLANTTGSCTAISNFTAYECGCKSEYTWNGSACVLIANSLPECTGANTFPCKDTETGLIWADKASDTMNWESAKYTCENDYNTASYGGFGAGWRMPTISELRTLIRDCSGTESDGDCKVREDSVVCLSESDECWDISCYDSCGTGGHGRFGESTWFWSSSSVSNGDDSKAWGVGFNGAEVDANSKTASKNFRCVKPICGLNYTWNPETSECDADKRIVSCSSSKPANSVWNDGGLNGTFEQVWNGSEWYPSSQQTHYNEDPIYGKCGFKCIDDYHWEDPKCVSNTKTFTCSGKPANSQWNSVSSYTQTWTGSAWSPADSTAAYNTESSTTSCRYKCNNNYMWDGSSCVTPPECSASSGTPCKDSAKNIVWSSKASSAMTWSNAKSYCSSYSEGSLTGWRLPTIDELITLLIADRVSENCLVSETNECLSYDDCWSCLTCTQTGTLSTEDSSCDSGTSYSDGRYSLFGDNSSLWSSSVSSLSNSAWGVRFGSGEVVSLNKSGSNYVRCVK